MLLAVDIGNTDIVFGFHDGNNGWSAEMRHPSAHYTTAGKCFKKWLVEHNISPHLINNIVLSSVVPGVTPSLLASLKSLTGLEPLILGMELYDKLPLDIDNPEEIGSDLVANAYASYQLFRKACIIVDFGTALTFTAVSAEGEIMGVAIAPGLKTAMKSLFANTAQLPMVPLDLPESVIGKNTAHAVQAGILGGYVGLVNEVLNRMIEEMGGDVFLVATGGLSAILKPVHERFDHIDRRLTLEGLRMISEKFSKPTH